MDIIAQENLKTKVPQKMATDGRDEKNRQKWDRIMEKGVESVLKDQPESLLRRARRGIPSEYR